MASGYPDFEGGKQRVYLTPEWAAKVGDDKHMVAGAGLAAYGLSTFFDYAVPATKTFYITSANMHIIGAVASADLNQIGSLVISDLTAGDFLLYQGGNGGVGAQMVQAIPIPAGHTVRTRMFNYTNHAVEVYGGIHGYEV